MATRLTLQKAQFFWLVQDTFEALQHTDAFHRLHGWTSSHTIATTTLHCHLLQAKQGKQEESLRLKATTVSLIFLTHMTPAPSILFTPN